MLLLNTASKKLPFLIQKQPKDRLVILKDKLFVESAQVSVTEIQLEVLEN